MNPPLVQTEERREKREERREKREERREKREERREEKRRERREREETVGMNPFGFCVLFSCLVQLLVQVPSDMAIACIVGCHTERQADKRTWTVKERHIYREAGIHA
jgi:hypothetical protein